MASTNFVDYVKTFCRSGAGGRGSAHLHRDKRTIKGGPDGGDGGRGGHVILRGNRNYWTLIHLKYKRHIFAGDGGDGSENRSTGADGEDVIVEVPLGTVARDADTGETICEITDDGETAILVKGGRGGQGNWHFKSPTNQTPRYAQPGEPRVERTVTGRRRACRFSQRREIHPAFRGHRGKTRNRQLPLHDPRAQPRHCELPGRAVLYHGRHPRNHRRGTCRQRAGGTVPPPHRAQLRAFVPRSCRQSQHPPRV